MYTYMILVKCHCWNNQWEGDYNQSKPEDLPDNTNAIIFGGKV